MNFTVKQRLAALILDAPRYLYFLGRYPQGSTPKWIQIRNRNQDIEVSESPYGIKCLWPWTSDLNLPKIYPYFGKKLFQRAFKNDPLKFAQSTYKAAPEVSFIIGHKGLERLPLLLKTVESIAAQENCNIECIVVEQDQQPKIKDALPKWVKYVFDPVVQGETRYSRSKAFNHGVKVAKSECLVLHDNDLLVPTNYAKENLELVKRGYDFTNLKRFIFYLSRHNSQNVIEGNEYLNQSEIIAIMQNAEGGSIGASKTAYNKIGGFDERFIGWGGEDNEFWERALTQKVWPYGYLPMIHLWHESQPEKMNIDASHTKALYEKLSKQSPEKRIDRLLTLEAQK